MKVMSIIGIVWFSISLLFIISFIESDPNAAAGWGILGMLYAIAFAIVALVKSLSKAKPNVNVHDQLLKLNELKEKNIISEEDFAKKKDIVLSKYN
jgi:fumarate reductase subunit C